MRVRSWGLLRNRGRVERVGPGGDAQAREALVRLTVFSALTPSARPHTGRHIPTVPRAGRGCTRASTRELGIMLCTMRNPLVAVGAGDYCLPKLDHQPCLLACLVTTQIALCAASSFEVFNTQVPQRPGAR